MKKLLLLIISLNALVIFTGLLKTDIENNSLIVSADSCPGGSVEACTQSCISGCTGEYVNECINGCPGACQDLCSGGSGNVCENGVCDAPGENSINCPQDCGGGASGGNSSSNGSSGGSSGNSSSSQCTVNFCNTAGKHGSLAGEQWKGSQTGNCYECVVSNTCAKQISCDGFIPGGIGNSETPQEEQSLESTNSIDTLSELQTQDNMDCQNACRALENTLVSNQCPNYIFNGYLDNSGNTTCRFENINSEEEVYMNVNCNMRSGFNLSSFNACEESSNEGIQSYTLDVALEVSMENPAINTCGENLIINAGRCTSASGFTPSEGSGLSYECTNSNIPVYCCSGEEIYNALSGRCENEFDISPSPPEEVSEENNISTLNECTPGQREEINSGRCTQSNNVQGILFSCDVLNPSTYNVSTFHCCPKGKKPDEASNRCIAESKVQGLGTTFLDNVISKVFAQPIPETLDPNLLDTGKYAIISPLYESAEVEILNDETKVRYFNDENGNGKKDKGEKYINTKDAQIKVSKTEEITKYKIQAGWNLLGFRFVNADINTASELIGSLAKQGIVTVQVSKYDSGNWINFVARVNKNGKLKKYGTDFNLIPGEGYFIRTTNSGSAILRGNVFLESVPVNLSPGWNLRSIQSVGKYTAQTFLQNCNANNITCSIISKYTNGLYESVIKDGEEYFGNDFKIKNNEGYFILNNGSSGTFKP